MNDGGIVIIVVIIIILGNKENFEWGLDCFKYLFFILYFKRGIITGL